MSRLAAAVLVSVAVLAVRWDPVSAVEQCEEIVIPMCSGPFAGLGYNRTRMPSLLGHQTQEEAGLEVHQFSPLITVGCDGDFQTFLCLVYAPECRDESASAVPPCRELCDAARAGCQRLMTSYGLQWPASLNCSTFPSRQSGEACVLPGADGGATGGPGAVGAPPTDSGSTETDSESTELPVPSEQCCQCGADAVSHESALRDGVESLVRLMERLQHLQEDTLKMQQANLRLEKQKLEMEIQLLRGRLETN